MDTETFPFPLGVQFTLSSECDYPAFRKRLRTIRELGYSVIELNIEDLRTADLSLIKDCLLENGLSMSNFATGATAKFEGLSLTTTDDMVRKDSITRTRELIEVAAYFDAGMIIGMLKGGPSEDPRLSHKLIVESLNQIVDVAEDLGILILLEAINRLETAIANTIWETEEIINEVGSKAMTILPDTYHISIEESSIFGSLSKYLDAFQTIHISDNNRRFPGFGCIDFLSLFRALIDAGYNGYLTLEGNTAQAFEIDLTIATQYLAKTFLKIYE